MQALELKNSCCFLPFEPLRIVVPLVRPRTTRAGVLFALMRDTGEPVQAGTLLKAPAHGYLTERHEPLRLQAQLPLLTAAMSVHAVLPASHGIMTERARDRRYRINSALSKLAFLVEDQTVDLERMQEAEPSVETSDEGSTDFEPLPSLLGVPDIPLSQPAAPRPPPPSGRIATSLRQLLPEMLEVEDDGADGNAGMLATLASDQSVSGTDARHYASSASGAGLLAAGSTLTNVGPPGEATTAIRRSSRSLVLRASPSLRLLQSTPSGSHGVPSFSGGGAAGMAWGDAVVPSAGGGGAGGISAAAGTPMATAVGLAGTAVRSVSVGAPALVALPVVATEQGGVAAAAIGAASHWHKLSRVLEHDSTSSVAQGTSIADGGSSNGVTPHQHVKSNERTGSCGSGNNLPSVAESEAQSTPALELMLSPATSPQAPVTMCRRLPVPGVSSPVEAAYEHEIRLSSGTLPMSQDLNFESYVLPYDHLEGDKGRSVGAMNATLTGAPGGVEVVGHERAIGQQAVWFVRLPFAVDGSHVAVDAPEFPVREVPFPLEEVQRLRQRSLHGG
ncbi:MAG: hypothetical protein EOO41_02980, partial [Methanobacteriota archaeon]